MKLKRMCTKAALICFFLTAIPFTGAFSADKVITFKFANFFPPQSSQSKLCEEFNADLEQQSGGRIKIQYFPGGALAKAPEVVKGVEMGIADIGFSHVEYTAGRFPVMEVCELPVGFPSGWVAVHVMNDFYNKYKPKEWDSVVPLWFHANTPSILATIKPIRTMDDFKGLTIRAPGRMASVISALGGTPAPTPIMETYDALAKGVIQGVFVGGEGVKTFRFGEVVKYVTNSWIIGPSYPFFVVMNKRSYAKLTGDLLPIFNKLCGVYSERFALEWNAADFPGEEFGKSKGVEYIEPSKEEEARWTKAVQPCFDEYIKDMVSRGFAETEINDWISYVKERKDYWLAKQIAYHIKSTTGPMELR